MCFFNEFFENQLMFHRFCYKYKYKIKKIARTLFYITFALCIFLFLIKSEILYYLANAGIVMFLIAYFVSKVNEFVTSLRSFLFNGLFSLTILFYFNSMLLAWLADKLNLPLNSNIPSIVNCLLVFFLWSFLSWIANNKVSTLANLILSTILGLTVYIKEFAVDSLSEYTLKYVSEQFEYNEYSIIKELISQCSDYFDTIFNRFLNPIFIMEILITLLCAVKGYWIDKYNDGKDITVELIENNETL